MPPFVYDTRPNPYAGSIGEMLLRRGDTEAQRAAAVANATAAATMASGAAWGGAVRDIGTNIGGQLMKVGERMADPAYQLEKEQVTRAQRENKSRNVFEAELRNPANYTPEGTIDDAKVTDRLKKQDIGAWQSWQAISTANAKNALDLRKELGDINKNDLEISEKQRLAQAAQQTYLGGLAFHTEQALKTKADDPLHARDTFMAGIARAVADGGLSGAKARDVLMRTAQASPEQLQQVIGSLVPQDLRAKFESEAATTAKTTADAAHLTAETANLTKYGSATPPASQMKPMRVKGVGDVPVEYVPGKAGQGGSYFLVTPEGGRKPLTPGVDFTEIPAASVQVNTANKAGAPGDFSKSGEEFLASIPTQWRRTVQKIAHYDEDPTKVASMRGGNREMLMQWVNQVNPGYDASQFTNRAPTRKAYTTGTQGQQITAINTAIGHLDQLAPLVADLNNGSFTPGNKVLNTLSSIFGSAKVTNFETLKDALAGEVASVLSKGAATVSGIAAEKEKIQAASSPAQLAGYVKTLIPLMGSKLASLDYQYHQAMGDEDSFSALSPTSKSVLAKYGFDAAQHTTADTPPPPAAMIEAFDPQGHVHHAPEGTPLPAGWKRK